MTKDIKEYNGIIIFGEMSTGKDALADFLLELNPKSAKYNIGNVVRQFIPIVKLNPQFKGRDRVFTQMIADKLREVHPMLLNDYCFSLIYSKWEKEFNWGQEELTEENLLEVLNKQLSQLKEKEIPIIVGGRTPNDFIYWSQRNFLVVGLYCDHEVRFNRLVARDGIEVARNSDFTHNTEIQVKDIVNNKCDIVIDNSFDFEHLKNEAQKLLSMF